MLKLQQTKPNLTIASPQLQDLDVDPESQSLLDLGEASNKEKVKVLDVRPPTVSGQQHFWEEDKGHQDYPEDQKSTSNQRDPSCEPDYVPCGLNPQTKSFEPGGGIRTLLASHQTGVQGARHAKTGASLGAVPKTVLTANKVFDTGWPICIQVRTDDDNHPIPEQLPDTWCQNAFQGSGRHRTWVQLYHLPVEISLDRTGRFGRLGQGSLLEFMENTAPGLESQPALQSTELAEV
jgi:hypothetical protein